MSLVGFCEIVDPSICSIASMVVRKFDGWEVRNESENESPKNETKAAETVKEAGSAPA